jgi:hypothetical protein
MTATTETAGTSAALAPVASGVLAQVQGNKPWTVASLAELLAGPAEKLPEAAPFPPPAEAVTFTPALRKALGLLSKVVGLVNPTTRRALEPSELTKLADERLAINAVTTPLGKRLDAISEMVRHHQDVQAEQAKLAVAASVVRGGQMVTPATERVADGVAKGHYLLAAPQAPFATPVEGYEDTWRQVYVSGKPFQSLTALEALLADGSITRQEYLAMTRETRSLAQDKVTAFIAKHPARGLEILAAITRRAPAGASLYAPKKKINEG